MSLDRPGLPAFRTWLVAGLAGVAIVAFAVVRAAHSPDAPPLDVAVVGDSFAEQAAPAMLAMAGERGVRTEVVAFGAPPCVTATTRSRPSPRATPACWSCRSPATT